MGELIHLDSLRLTRPVMDVVHRPRPEETIRQAADMRMVDRILEWAEARMATTLHRPLEPRDRVTVLRLLAIVAPEPRP
jgi:hypothetical protein